jgi:outer membrane protein assembly factor BamB/ABC-type phosphate/phosphonate transport system substrate-binding protein
MQTPIGTDRRRWLVGLLFLALVIGASFGAGRWLTGNNRGQAAILVVMDPLAKPLGCACVRGYAQRDYDKLAAFLGKRLGQEVRVVYSEDLGKALRRLDPGRLIAIVGKESVVSMDAQQNDVKTQPICRLTDKDGGTTITGLFAVKAGDTARNLADLNGKRIFFGPKDSDEKHSAALAALRRVGVWPPENPEIRPGCSDAAMEVQESHETPSPACVISSYALPLLEGCGNIEKGSLRVVGKTGPVPFVTVFVNSSLSDETQDLFLQALLAVGRDQHIRAALESRDGFVEIPETNDWPGWRGVHRDGLVPALPEKLPAGPTFMWKKPLDGLGLAGIAVADGLVMVAGRDLLDQRDVFQCLRASDGALVWELSYPAPGKLDYGQSPRATPLVHRGKVYLLGAFGDLHCVRLLDGKFLWRRNLPREFDAPRPKWGFSASPLIANDILVVNVGAKKAALAGLDRFTGKTVWTVPGGPAAYASLVMGTFGGKTQIVGYDASSLNGWDPETGRHLWRLVPPNSGDFNVPTPIAWQGKLIVATENNGTRLYEFNVDGTIAAKPTATFPELAPDVNTPLVANGRLFGCHGDLYCLDLLNGLKPVWTAAEPAFADFVSLIGGPDRVLLTSYHGELLLFSATGDSWRMLSRLRVFDDDTEVVSHPALVGSRLFIRDGSSIGCLELAPAEASAGSLSAR